jgi:hypothetical protein
MRLIAKRSQSETSILNDELEIPQGDPLMGPLRGGLLRVPGNAQSLPSFKQKKHSSFSQCIHQ